MTDKRDIQRRIKSIKTRGEKIDKDIHDTAILCMIHAMPKPDGHNDISLMSELVDAMPKSGRRKALAAWVVDHAPVHFNEKEQAFKLRKNRQKEDFLVEQAQETPFWDYTKEKQPTQYDLEKAINSLHRALVKARDQGNLETSEDVVVDRLRHTVHDVYATAPSEESANQVITRLTEQT